MSLFSLSLFQVTPEGTFLDVRTIGRFCYEDDLLTLSAVYTEAQAESQPGFPRLYTDKTINSLKHRLLVYLWRRAEQDGSATAKRRYRTFFSMYSYLKMLGEPKVLSFFSTVGVFFFSHTTVIVFSEWETDYQPCQMIGANIEFIINISDFSVRLADKIS